MTRHQNLQDLHEPPRSESHLAHAKRGQRLVVGVDGKHLPIQRVKDDGTMSVTVITALGTPSLM